MQVQVAVVAVVAFVVSFETQIMHACTRSFIHPITKRRPRYALRQPTSRGAALHARTTTRGRPRRRRCWRAPPRGRGVSRQNLRLPRPPGPIEGAHARRTAQSRGIGDVTWAQRRRGKQSIKHAGGQSVQPHTSGPRRSWVHTYTTFSRTRWCVTTCDRPPFQAILKLRRGNGVFLARLYVRARLRA